MRIKSCLFLITAAVSCALVILPVNAQSPAPAMPQSETATVQTKAKVVAIDYTSRIITLQDSQGNSQTMQVGPEVKRFNQIKVGDTITFTYEENTALAIVKQSAAMPEAPSTPALTRGTGEKPNGTISQTQTTTVTIESIDTNKPSVTVKTAEGRTVTFLVQDKNYLNGLKPGDIVQVTYRQALMITVQ